MFNDKKLWKVIFIISISILLGYILLLHILWQNVYLISVNEKAGLGNQMFMYAANFAKSKTSNRHVCRLDSTNNLAKIYPLSVPRCNFFLRYIQDYLLLKKCSMSQYSDEYTTRSSCVSWIGYMQNEAYFLGKKNEIEQEFQLKKKLTAKNQEMVQQMEKENSVCLHFRRGDYLETGYPVLGLEYYNQGIEYIKDKTQKDVTLYVFSNDMPWVKKNFRRSEKTLYVEDNDAATDMELMKHCKHNIIANSSYSWWSAYLNKNPDKIVVAPDTWDYRHPWWGDEIILKDWVKLPAHAKLEIVQKVDYPKNNVAILYIATGNYIKFWDNFYINMERCFLPDMPKTYFVFTDDEEKKFPENAKKIATKFEPWPNPTLKRFHYFLGVKDKLKSFKYVYFLNANLYPNCFENSVGEEILPTEKQQLVFTEHFGSYGNKRNSFPYEKNKESQAFVAQNNGYKYVAGGFFGGLTATFLNMVQELDSRIKEDTKNGVTARWHDESHLNRYLLDLQSKGKTPLILEPIYLIPEESIETTSFPNIEKFKKNPKMVLLDKDKHGGKRYLRKQNSFLDTFFSDIQNR